MEKIFRSYLSGQEKIDELLINWSGKPKRLIVVRLSLIMRLADARERRARRRRLILIQMVEQRENAV